LATCCGAAPSAGQLSRALGLDRRAGFKTPKRIIFVDELPKNASGKILKRELRSRLADTSVY
jgi:acyl-coenzyme A synthetase/AMP-(fatty) acid ligase